MNKVTTNTSATDRSKLGIACALTLAALASTCAHAATTIYEDSFSGSPTSDLASTAIPTASITTLVALALTSLALVPALRRRTRR